MGHAAPAHAALTVKYPKQNHAPPSEVLLLQIEKYMTTTENSTATVSRPEALILPSTVVWTPEIDRMAQKVARWIRIDQPGGVIYGAQRNGKSRACSYLVGMLSSLLDYELAVLHWTIPDQAEAKKNEREFVQEMLQQSGCLRVGSRDLAVLRRRCYTHLSELTEATGSKRVVIIIDEAQNLGKLQFSYLIHAFNSLEQMGIQPFFLLVGQPELRNQFKTWSEGKGMQVLGRFFAREHQYRGIALNEIGLVLQAFDMPVEGESVSVFSRAFPEAYKAGWRLEHLTPHFDEALALIMRKHNIASGLRLPMQYFRSTVLSVLNTALDEGIAPEMLTSAHVLLGLEEAGFLSVLGFYVDSDPDPRQERAAGWSRK